MATTVEAEPNNTLSSAQPVALGNTVTGSLASSTDVDYYRVSFSASGVFRYDFSSGAPSSAWSYTLNIRDAAGHTLATSFVGYGYAASLQVGIAAAGDYTVQVAKNSNYYGGQYSLTLSNPAGSAADYETWSGSSLAGANPLRLDHPMTGQIGGALKDYFQLSASADGLLTLDFSAPSVQTYKTFTVSILDASGSVVQTIDTGGHQTLLARVPAAATYYVEVDGKNYDSGNYVVSAHLFSAGDLAKSPSLSASAPISATLVAGTPGLFQVTLVAGTIYEFAAKGSGSGGGTLADPSLVLLNANLVQLESCDNLSLWSTTLNRQSTSADPQIAFTAPQSGTYYLAVSGSGAAGSYTLSEATDTSASLAQAVLDLPSKSYARWNGGSALGSHVSLSYSFLTSSADLARNPGDTSETGFAAMTSAQQQMVRNVLAVYGGIAGISFTETASNASADMRFGTSNQGTASSGYTHWWATNGSFEVADVFINNAGSYLSTMIPGGFGYETLIHETGHALGLKHPGNYDASGSGASPPYLPSALDNTKFSLMSYVSNPDASTNWTTPALLDIAAVQYLYGVSDSGLGQAHSYRFSATTPFCESLSGTSTPNVTATAAGGSGDTLDISNQTLPSQVFLTAGCLSSIGAGAGGIAVRDNLAIPFGQSVTAVIDGPAADLIVGNGLDNSFYGFSGANTVEGGGGSDTLMLTATSADLNAAADAQLSGVQNINASSGSKAMSIDLHLQTEAIHIVGSGFGDVLTGSSGGASITGGAGDDTVIGFRSADVIDGGGGTNTLRMGATSTDLNLAADGQIRNFQIVDLSGATAAVSLDLHNQSETIAVKCSPYGDVVTASGGGGSISGGAGRDSIYSGLGVDTIDGAGGVDTVIYPGAAASIQRNPDGSYRLASDTLKNVERVQFSVTKFALDTGSDQAAGEVALLLGVVVGPSTAPNKQYMGIGLGLLDGGMSYPDLMQFALDAVGATSHAAVVNLVWKNLFNAVPASSDAQPYVDLLDSGAMSVGALAVIAAKLSQNADNIHLVGLQATGIEYS